MSQMKMLLEELTELHAQALTLRTVLIRLTMAKRSSVLANDLIHQANTMAEDIADHLQRIVDPEVEEDPYDDPYDEGDIIGDDCPDGMHCPPPTPEQP